MLGEPSLYLLGLVGLVVVADRVDVEVLCDGPIDLFQEADELLGAVTRQALADDLASLDIECRKQRRRAIAFVVVRHRLSTALLHRQAWLCAIERLNLAFLVDAEHNRLVGRVEVEPDDVDHFFSEFWIVGELEWARQMWLEAMLLPDALHGRVADADLLGQHTRTPVRCVPGLLVGCACYNREPQFGTDWLLARAPPLAPVLKQALDAAVHVSFLPAPNRRLRHPSLALDGIRPQSATRQQHNACACNDFLRRLAIGDEPLQCRAVTGPDVQACINVSHAAVKSDLQALGNPINGSEH